MIRTLLKRSLPVIILFTVMVGGAAQAQVTEARVRVDGLSCPFCAYGLEKKMKGISGVGKVEINVKEGMATLTAGSGASVDIEVLEEAVSKAGFTPREIRVTARGIAKTEGDTPALVVAGTDIVLMFESDERFGELRQTAPGPTTEVRVTGALRKVPSEGHAGHPYSIAIERFEVLQ